MSTDELSIFGYCCTGREDSARHPIRTMTRLTTIASTGCLMNKSVNEARSGRAGGGVRSASTVRPRLGRRAGLRDDDEDAFTELERARRGDRLAGGEAR